MMPFRCRSLLVLVAALGLAGAGRAEEKGLPIRDEAGLFKPAAVAEAQKKIDEIRAKYHLGLMVETVPPLPVERKWWWSWRFEVHHRMDEKAKERAREANLAGVVVLICKEPKVEVVVLPSQERFFTTVDAAGLRRRVLKHLKAGEADAALKDIVKTVGDILQKSRADQQPALAGSEWVLAVALGSGVGLWGLVGLLRKRMRPAGAGEPLELKPALLAGRFGSPAAFWVYDPLFLARRASVPIGTPVADAPGSPEVAGTDVPADEEDPVALREGP